MNASTQRLATSNIVATMANDAMVAFADNVRRLMAHYGWSQTELRKRSGVGQTTISALIRYGDSADKVARLDTVNGMAKAFNVEPWMLQVKDIPLDMLLDKKLAKLVDTYGDVSPEARENIHRVAESEARYDAYRGTLKKAG